MFARVISILALVVTIGTTAYAVTHSDRQSNKSVTHSDRQARKGRKQGAKEFHRQGPEPNIQAWVHAKLGRERLRKIGLEHTASLALPLRYLLRGKVYLVALVTDPGRAPLHVDGIGVMVKPGHAIAPKGSITCAPTATGGQRACPGSFVVPAGGAEFVHIRIGPGMVRPMKPVYKYRGFVVGFPFGALGVQRVPTGVHIPLGTHLVARGRK